MHPWHSGLSIWLGHWRILPRAISQLILNVDFDDRKVDMVAEGYDLVVRIGALKDSSLKACCLLAALSGCVPVRLLCRAMACQHILVISSGCPQ